MNKVLLFNPRATDYKPRIPNSILSIASSIEGVYDYTLVDGNMEKDAFSKIFNYLNTGEYKFFGCTVMPGPQLKQAIPFSKKIRENFPEIKIIWGGYFPSNQYKTVLNSGYVDYVINGPGDKAFPALLDALEKYPHSLPSASSPFQEIPNLIFKAGEKIIVTSKDEIYEQDSLPPLPYGRLNSFYPIKKYLGKTYHWVPEPEEALRKKKPTHYSLKN